MSSSEPASLGVLMFIWQTTEEKKHKNLELTLKYCVIKLLHSTVFEVGCVDEFKHQKIIYFPWLISNMKLFL